MAWRGAGVGCVWSGPHTKSLRTRKSRMEELGVRFPWMCACVHMCPCQVSVSVCSCRLVYLLSVSTCVSVRLYMFAQMCFSVCTCVPCVCVLHLCLSVYRVPSPHRPLSLARSSPQVNAQRVKGESKTGKKNSWCSLWCS